jgi:hypothetical protein
MTRSNHQEVIMDDQQNDLAQDEATQRILDPHRVEEQRNARQEAESRLSSRDIPVVLGDQDEDVANILDAIERFEAEVERSGGDLMVNQIGSSEPEDPDFVPPIRDSSEPASDYLRRIEEKIDRLVERRQETEEAR